MKRKRIGENQIKYHQTTQHLEYIFYIKAAFILLF